MRELIINVTDLETTGLSALDGHRIIEISMALVKIQFEDDNTFAGFKQIGKTWCQRINPKRSIDEKAQQVHGIDIKELKGEPEWESVAGRVNKLLTACDVVVAHNIDFDIPFLATEIARVGLEIPDIDAFCTLESGRTATAMGKVPSLKELCWVMGVKYDESEAHAADYDVDCTVQALIKGLQLGYFDLSGSLNKKYGTEEEAA